ncbi:ribonuclease J [Candidatus Woesearchaeota archaeon CG10_big_fil_rev_8_21_14_0_10_34_8]|jgi:ribonuclease J|nr:MAG: ribonuclease J [Candidatus Woesearchaeota archaeon CG10_big_fil_rev_8_21_14_0_10_34_8]
MKVEICAVGGFSEVGRNMTAVKVDNEVVIFDIGLYLPKIINYEEEEGSRQGLSKETMIEIDAVPDITMIDHWKGFVKAIVTTHCHLDHIGAMPYLAPEYDAPIIGTPYTLEVLKTILKDERIKIKNELKPLNINSKLRISKNLTVEFINMTHSTLQTVMIALHTPAGVILYCNDFKFDNHPIIGKKPNFARLKELGDNKEVLVVVADALYSKKAMKTPSEKVAREMLKDVLLGVKNEDNAIIVTTFASHIARLQSILDMGMKLRRKVVFLGRSLNKYITAAENLHLVNFTSKAEIFGYASKVKKELKEISKNKGNYLIVCTGNQGEPGSILRRMSEGDLPFNFDNGDHVVFACKTIPAPVNLANRAVLEEKLIRKGCRLFKDIHVSGHAAKEDHRDLFELVKPKHIIPSHGSLEQTSPMSELATTMGYVLGKTVHLMRNGQILELD